MWVNLLGYGCSFVCAAIGASVLDGRRTVGEAASCARDGLMVVGEAALCARDGLRVVGLA